MAARPPTADGAARDALSEESIVRAARAIIAESGVAGLNMRRLSEDLGVALGATYHHVRNRQALLRLVAQDIHADLELPEAETGGWTEQIHVAIVRYVRLLHRYPGMDSEIAHDLVGMASPKLEAFVMERLAAGGFTGDEAVGVVAAIFFYVSGATLLGQFTGIGPDAESVVNEHFEVGLRMLLRGAAQSDAT